MADKSKQNKDKNIVGEQVQDREIVQEMQESYLAYAMSVIVSRALPDVRDGLKPVHRRILYAMNEMGLRHNVKFVKSARIVGECFIKDTLVSTSDGLKPIQDIQIGEKVFTHTGLKPVTNLYVMPPKPLIRVSLSNGISVTVTPKQKLKVFNKDGSYSWKEANNLTSNDWLTLKTPYPNNLIPLKLSKFNGKQKYLNQNIGYIMGLLVSDGWITRDYGGKTKHRRLGFCSNELSTAERIVRYFKDEFEYEPTITSREYTLKLKSGEVKINRIFIVRINRKDINNFLVGEFGIPEDFKANSKFIPNKILSSPEEVIYAFVSGLMDGDGSVAKRNAGIIYTSISEKLINQFQILLQNMGIFSQRYVQKQASRSAININGRGISVQGSRPAYTLEFSGLEAQKLARELNLASEKKKKRLVTILNSNPRRLWSKFGTLPYGSEIIFSELSRMHIGSGWYQGTDGQKFRMGIHYAGGGKLRYSSNLASLPLTLRQVEDFGILDKFEKLESRVGGLIKEIVDNDINFLKVKKVERATPEETYDIEVAGDHQFVANGVISHNCMGKFHPHGDAAIYDSMVRMAQDFSLRYPLVDGQGNFGSLDSDPPAAQRYTEARLSSIAEEVLTDLDKDTVDFVDNYDASRKEPVVLPTRIPTLLINGQMGIAVGMATSIPPHNLTEVLDGLVHLIDNPEADVADLNQFVKGPDFPTAGIIYNEKDILNAYATGKGPIIMRAKADIVEGKKGFQIIVTEIPYQVNKAELISKIAELAMGKERKVDGIKDVRDESDREGVRVVVDLKQDAFPKKVLNQLFKYTELQKTFHINMLALVDGIQPQILGLKGVLEHFIEHRRVVVVRRAKFELKKAKDRAHILEGLKKALDHIDAIIKLIRASSSQEEALKNLMKKFSFTQLQATAILEMKLRALAGLERKKVEDELAEKKKLIAELEALLASSKKILALVKQEFLEIKEKYGDERRTKIVKSALKEIGEEELMPEEDSLFMITRGGYLKRMAPDVLKVQKRGGKGLIGIETKEEDIVTQFFMANTHDTILFFTNSGRAFQVKGYEVPESSRTSKGKAIVNFLNISPSESVTAVVPIAKDRKGVYLFMATKNGVVKKVALTDFQKVRSNGLAAIKLKKDDELKWVWGTSGQDQIIMISSDGNSIRFKESDVRAMGRTASGVIGMRLEKDVHPVKSSEAGTAKQLFNRARIIGMEVVSGDVPEKDFKLLVVMDKGYGKRTDLRYYKVQHRGGRGIMTAKLTPKTGQIISAHLVNPEDKEIIAVSQKGQVIRTELGSISVLGRATQGVRIMRLSAGDSVASVVVV